MEVVRWRKIDNRNQTGEARVMKLLALFKQLASTFREFVAPRYRPELYYMRGPGPASVRRAGTLKQNQSIGRYV